MFDESEVFIYKIRNQVYHRVATNKPSRSSDAICIFYLVLVKVM